MFGGLFGGDDEQESTTTSTPWAPQGEELEFAFDEARDLYTNGSGRYDGDRVADLTPEQQQALQQMYGWNSGMGGNMTNALYDNGMAQANQWQGAANFASGTLNGSGYAAPQNTGPDMNLVNSLYNNELVQGQIDSATGDIYDNLYQNQITGINSGAAATGNMGSSRAGVAEAMARNGAADMAADVSSGIISNAYNTAVGQAGQVASQNASLGMQNNQLNAQNNQYAANMLNGISQNGMANMVNANSMFTNNTNTALNAGNIQQNQNQNEINGEMQAGMQDWDLLNRYYGIIGSGNWGGTQQTVGSMPSQLGGQLLQAGSQLGAAYMMGSDRRLKDNIQPIGKRGKLTRVTWQWNDTAKALGWGDYPTEGYIAQDVQKHYPAFVGEMGGYLAIDYTGLERTLADEQEAA